MHKLLLTSLAATLALASCGKSPQKPVSTVSTSVAQSTTHNTAKTPKTYFAPAMAVADMTANVLYESSQPALQSQIVNGSISERGARPYQVAVYNLSGRQFCGGTLIAKDWVLTAAHCIITERLYVRAGVNKLSDKNQGGYYTVSHIYKHPAYTSANSGYDIALLKLSDNVSVKHASVAGLPDSVVDSVLSVAGKRAVVSGWGDQFSGSRVGSDDLLEITISITPNPTVCGKNIIAPNVICGNAEEGKDSCQGDSGGPLASQLDGKAYVLGVVSYGIGCSGDGVYTRVSAYTNWIERVSGVKAGSDNPDLGVDLGPVVQAPVEYRSELVASKYSYAPSKDGFQFVGGTLEGELIGPAKTDFDLYLQTKNSAGVWQTVGYSVMPNSSEKVIQKVPAGFYRWVTHSFSGSGEAVLTEQKR